MSEPNKSAADFQGLVAGLGATVMAMLQQVDPHRQPEKSDDETQQAGISAVLDNARQLISTLTMLEEKTKGNLTDEEQQFLATTITDVKFAFVRLQEATAKKP